MLLAPITNAIPLFYFLGKLDAGPAFSKKRNLPLVTYFYVTSELYVNQFAMLAFFPFLGFPDV